MTDIFLKKEAPGFLVTDKISFWYDHLMNDRPLIAYILTNLKDARSNDFAHPLKDGI